ncbi:N-acetylneuraminate synthase family protein [Leptospira interrogans]|uniref:NeuB family protein n=1 Tax=Leptospira interrogans serovar Pyrogenes str. L0374 TaxID=1049928 RepID=M6KXQ0_LEPIR|nr:MULTISPECIES: N-acetylneuraminate synthase family protein [Leptospira]EMN32567.1 NeuB family protein [Leptospira interrogans serovar Pyrogenes str. L0374]EKO08644.1 NeuB family protein [Leptospira interrogans str. C10069]EMN62279.1 NeuB family protein [Leptospira interrogans serovar Pyrogenes str. R168]MBE0305534.1 TIM barrel protein [Leptospira interrogans serovar Yeoncheon]ULG85676.1 N-acetylneuraminate synthase family protein [Leptospira interrogans]
MIIDKNISQYVVFWEDSIKNALKKIEANKSKTIFAVSEGNKLMGVITDGDFRRWILNDETLDRSLDQEVKNIINTNFKYLYVTESSKRIRSTFNNRISIIPLINENGILEAIAKETSEEILVEGISLSQNSPAFVIAEIGNNHNGSFELAKKLVREAKLAGADCAKFQMRNLDALYRNSGNANDAEEDLGSQYTLDLLNKFQLSDDELFRIFDYCREESLIPLCTPWDEESFFKLESYGIPAYKIASADFTNHELIRLVAKSGKPVICSTGMSTEDEIMDSIHVLQDLGAQYVLLHCNSTYPAPFKDINLRYIEHLKKSGGCLVGYSGHERGYLVALAAVSLGAKVIEKHFTLDREMEGNDHKVSLLPGEFREMVDGIRQIEESLGNKNFRQITQGELMNRETLGKSLLINRDLKLGEIITSDMVDIRSPGKGLPPYFKEKLIGKSAKRDFKKGDFFYKSDIADDVIEFKKKFIFSRPWGLPVRYHDLEQILSKVEMDLVEFHFSYKDLKVEISEYIKKPLNTDFVVHCPELFENDHLLDLCTEDEDYRKRSLIEIQKVIDITRRLKDFFPNSNKKPFIVTNVGGFSLNKPLDMTIREKLYRNLSRSLNDLDSEGVEIIPQTMPPFPWLFGGQRYHNLFLSAEEIVEFCKRHSIRICLDVSHSKLACNHYHWSFSKFVEQVSPYVAHLHIVDAKGVDGEGLQIGEGEIDFHMLSNILREKAPKASFIPEIWQGHKNNGEGFLISLTRLEKFHL